MKGGQQKSKGGAKGKRKQAGANAVDQTAILDGVFSWTAAWCMMAWVLAFICSLVMGVLTYQNSGIERISEEISFIRAPNPPYGPANQPAPQRDINEPFLYHLPQVALYYALAACAVGMFTVCYFTNTMLLEDQGSPRVVDICSLVAKGVTVYLERTYPMVGASLFFTGWYVLGTAGWGTLACFACGASLNLLQVHIGVRIILQGTGRLAHLMGHGLSESLHMGVRTGNVGGLLASSLALGGMAMMWLWILDTKNLSGFASGASIVSFYIRVGGGIFSKGAELGGDLVSDMDDNKHEEERRVFELQRKMAEIEEKRKEQAKSGEEGGNQEEDMMDQLRMMEDEMQDMVSTIQPIDFLDAVGETICDVAGTCADLFESMVLILSTSAIIGAKGSPVPHFQSGLPFWTVASGNVGCAVVAYFQRVQERYTSSQLRWSLRINLIVVIVFVQLVQIAVCYGELSRGMIDFESFWHFIIITLMGQLAPEICIMFGEFFTSIDHGPVKSLAANASMGVVQVVLQGLGQGFFSTGFPAAAMVAVVMVSWELEGHYGLALLSTASVSATAFQGGICCFGAVATNAHRIVHLTTYHSLTRHRANILAALGDSTAHSGDTLCAVNAFSAVFNIAVTLLAQTYTRLGLDYGAVSGSPLSEWSQAGLVMGVVMTLFFTANTTLSCLETSKHFLKFCKESEDVVSADEDLPFPESHMKPLAALTSYGTITSMRLVFSPVINSLACPMMGGFLLGSKGLLFVLSGANVLILCLCIFLMNSGQSWVAAKKYILFGQLRDSDGVVVGPDSVHYANIGVGVMIGGPFEDTTGPSLNNFIKFVAVFALVTEPLYQSTPEDTWHLGFVTIIVSFLMVVFSKFGLTVVLNCVTRFLKHRAEQLAKRKAEEGEDDSSSEEDEEEAAEDGEPATLVPVQEAGEEIEGAD